MAQGRASVVITVKPDNPGRLTLQGPDGERELGLAAMKPEELRGLADELSARGLEVSLVAADVEAPARGLLAEGVFRALGLAPPYAAYERALARPH